MMGVKTIPEWPRVLRVLHTGGTYRAGMRALKQRKWDAKMAKKAAWRAAKKAAQ